MEIKEAVGSKVSKFSEKQNPKEVYSQSTLEYIAGYFDFAGHISIDRSKLLGGRSESFVLRLEVERAAPEVVNLLDEVFPSYSTLRRKESSGGKSFLAKRWLSKAKKTADFIENVGPLLIVKREQIKIANEFIEAKGIRTREDMWEFKRRIQEVNGRPSFLRVEPVSMSYLAGIFDANGNIGLNNPEGNHFVLQVRIQSSNEEFVNFLAKQFGQSVGEERDERGRKTQYRVSFGTNKGLEFLTSILPYLRVKKRLAEIAVEFQRGREGMITRTDLKGIARRAREKELLDDFTKEQLKIDTIKRSER